MVNNHLREDKSSLRKRINHKFHIGCNNSVNNDDFSIENCIMKDCVLGIVNTWE